jgi:hypothetical protein
MAISSAKPSNSPSSKCQDIGESNSASTASQESPDDKLSSSTLDPSAMSKSSDKLPSVPESKEEYSLSDYTESNMSTLS